MIDAQIFTYATEKDLAWLNCSLRSIQRYWNSSFAPIIITSSGCRNALPRVVSEVKARVFFEQSGTDKNLGRAMAHLHADCYVNTDLILFLDPECLFTRSCSAQSFTDNDVPVIFTDSWENTVYRSPCALQNVMYLCRDIVSEFFDITMDNDYERRIPVIFNRHSIRKARLAIQKETHRPLNETLAGIYSDYLRPFNILGAFCENFENGNYQWQHISSAPAPFVRKFSSATQDPTKGNDLAEVNRILCQNKVAA
jgi:hypothetical protein